MVVSRDETQKKLDLLSSGVMKHTPEQTYTVADRFEEHAENFGDRLFLIYEDKRISYGELNRQANRYAYVARQQGLKRGDVAAVMMENRPDFIYAWLGLAKLGVIAALFNTHARSKALEHAVKVTGSQLLFLGEECVELFQTVEGLADQITTLVVNDGADESLVIPAKTQAASTLLQSADESNPDKALRQGLVGEDPLYYVFTSGTTGLPKAAVLSHMRWLGVGDGWANLLGITADDMFYCVLPMFHGAAGMSLLSNAVSVGAPVLLRRRFSVSRFWPDVREYGVTTVQYIGEMGRYLINQPSSPEDKNHTIKRLTGAGFSAGVWRQFIERFGPIDIYEGWGATESNCNMMNMDNAIGSCGRLPYKDRSNARLVKYDREGACHLRDENGFLIECDADEVGELIGMVLNIPGIGAGRFEGYTDPQATENKILRNVFAEGDAWYRSGDLFTRDEDDYYYFVDRMGDTFRWKSENVSTTEVAEVLLDYPEAEIINVYGVEIPNHEGRAGMAAIVLKEGTSFDAAAFFQLAKEKLPEYAIPLFLRIGGQADMTATYKLRKVDLQRQGYNPANFTDDLYVLHKEAESYESYCLESLENLAIRPFAAD